MTGNKMSEEISPAVSDVSPSPGILDLMSLISFYPFISITDQGRRTHLCILVCQMNLTAHYINLSSPGGLCVSAQQVKKRSQTWQR